MLPTQINRLSSHFVSTKTADDAQSKNTTLPIETEFDAQRTTNTNSSITNEEISATLKQKKEVCKKLKEIHRESEFHNLDLFQDDEDNEEADD